MQDTLREFMFAIPRARAPAVQAWCCRPDQSALRRAAAAAAAAQDAWAARAGCLRTAVVRRQCFFPDRRLLQYDCGKLVELAVLLRKLKAGGHRVLIFTQVCVRVCFGCVCVCVFGVCAVPLCVRVRVCACARVLMHTL
jgi:E1A-binding protein p400